MTESLGERLDAIHHAIGDEPLPERLEAASCGPHIKHLVHLAISTASAGGTADDWRTWLSHHVPEATPKLRTEAEECMHESGLWPWKG